MHGIVLDLEKGNIGSKVSLNNKLKLGKKYKTNATELHTF